MYFRLYVDIIPRLTVVLLYDNLFLEVKMIKKAFTLAELLITLGIIGVVAAITLPSLIVQYQDKVLATKTKRAYSLIQQAIQKNQSESGTVGDVTSLFDTNKSSIEVLENFGKYFNVVKICRSASECPNENYVILYSYPLYLGNGKATAGSLKYPYLVLADGTFISIIQYGACIRESSAIAFNPDGTAKKDDNGNVIYQTFQEKYCADLRFDVNGKALPNQYGRDAFEIRYSADGKISGWSATGFDNLIKILRGEDVVYTKYKFGDAKK